MRMRPTGLTLLETLVAMAIFAVVAIMAYRGLARALAVRTQLQTVRTTWQARALAWYRLYSALGAARPQPGRNGTGTRVPAFRVRHDNHRTRISLTVGGATPLASRGRSNLRRVSFTVQKGRLLWQQWPVLDRAPDSRRVTGVLLQHIARWQLQVRAPDGHWVRHWPPGGALTQWPTLVRVTIVPVHGHRLRWLLPVAR